MKYRCSWNEAEASKFSASRRGICLEDYTSLAQTTLWATAPNYIKRHGGGTPTGFQVGHNELTMNITYYA